MGGREKTGWREGQKHIEGGREGQIEMDGSGLSEEWRDRRI